MLRGKGGTVVAFSAILPSGMVGVLLLATSAINLCAERFGCKKRVPRCPERIPFGGGEFGSHCQ